MNTKTILFAAGLLLLVTLGQAQMAPLSKGIYRLPYDDGTTFNTSQDHLTHSPSPNRLDLRGVGGTQDAGGYRIVAAADGVIRWIEDQHNGSCSIPGVTSCSACNNYVWIEHPNGEWTKYTHFATGTVSGAAGLNVGDPVCAGTFLGYESDIGATRGSDRPQFTCDGNAAQQALINQANLVQAQNGQPQWRTFRHLHFEVGVPTDLTNPFDTVGGFLYDNNENRIPLFCGVPGGVVVQGQQYTTADCATGDCPDAITLPNFTETGIRLVQMDKTIDTGGSLYTVANTGQVQHRAGQSIRLQAGFRVNPGAYYNARIAPCNRMKGTPLASCLSQALGFRSEEEKEEMTDLTETADSYTVFPNPTTGLITLRREGRQDRYPEMMLFDNMGRQLEAPVDFSGNSAMLDLRWLPDGLYWLRLIDGEQMVVKKVVKQQ